MKKCLIIGSKGYLGRHLENYLLQSGVEVLCYDIAEDVSSKNYKTIDLTKKDTLKEIELDADFIFFLAGMTGTFIGFDMYDKYISTNEIGLLNLLDTIRHSKYRPRIIFPSTRLVYKGVDRPLKENDEKETKTIYAVTKLACEGILQAYSANFDIDYTVFRICVPYGNIFDSDYSYGVIGSFVKTASVGKDITLYGGGNIKRTFTYIEDLCYQMIQCSVSEKSKGEIFNIGGEILSLKDVALTIAGKYKTQVVDVPWPDKDFRLESNHTYFDDFKIQTLIGSMTYKKISDIFSV